MTKAYLPLDGMRLAATTKGRTFCYADGLALRLNTSLDSEPPLAKYLLPPTPPRAQKFAEPQSSSGLLPVLPRLLSHPVPPDRAEVVGAREPVSVAASTEPSLPSGFVGEATLMESEAVSKFAAEAATIGARKPHPPFQVWAMPVAIASIVLTVLGILLFGPSSLKIQRSVAARDHSVFTQPVSVHSTSVDQPQLPVEVSASPLPSAQPIAKKKKSHASVRATHRSRVVACADRKVLFSLLFTGGDGQTVEFDRDAIERVGSAGSVQIMKDGTFTGMLGKTGEVRIVAFTSETSNFLSGGEAEDCTEGH